MRWLVLALFLLAGCSEPAQDTKDPTATSTSTSTSATATGTTDPGTPQTHEVAISGFKFVPASLDISVGDTVIWTNMDSASHTVDSTDGGPLDSGTMGQGDTFSFTFTQAEDFAYRCDIHPSMTGSITAA